MLVCLQFPNNACIFIVVTFGVPVQSVNALIHIRSMFEVAVSQRHQIQVPLRDLQIVKKVHKVN